MVTMLGESHPSATCRGPLEQQAQMPTQTVCQDFYDGFNGTETGGVARLMVPITLYTLGLHAELQGSSRAALGNAPHPLGCVASMSYD